MGKIIVDTPKFCHVINKDDIVYCQSRKGQLYIFIRDGSNLNISTSISDFKIQLNDPRFICPYKGYLVNINYVRSFQCMPRLHLILLNGNKIPISISRKKTIIQAIQKNSKTLTINHNKR